MFENIQPNIPIPLVLQGHHCQQQMKKWVTLRILIFPPTGIFSDRVQYTYGLGIKYGADMTVL
jgi:hypothetical protein